MLFVIIQYIRVMIHIKIESSKGYRWIDLSKYGIYPKTIEMLKKHGYAVYICSWGVEVEKIKQEGTK